MTLFGDEQRLQLAAAAARTERSTQPRHLLVLALVLLVAAVTALAVTWTSHVKAVGRLRTEEATAGQVATGAAKLKALKAAAGSQNGPRANEKIGQILTLIENASADAGMKSRAQSPSQRRDPFKAQNTVRVKLEYTVRDPSLAAIMDWARRSCEQVPGLEFYAIDLAPEAQNWRATITFVRWEREQSS